MELVDSHCHLDDAQFDGDRGEVIARAQAAGLKYLLAIGTGDGPPRLDAAVRLAEAYSFVYATVGVHPNDAAKIEDGTIANLGILSGHPKVIAIGEIGLDYHWDVPRDIQIPLFEAQLNLARQSSMPVVIHTRDAWEDTLAILRAHWTGAPGACVMHCFTGDEELARRCLDAGYYLAFGGVVTYPKAAEVRDAVTFTPIDRMLIETDCPYLAPVPYRGKRNEPAYVVNTAQAIAQLRGTSVEDIAARTTSNFERIFSLPTAHDVGLTPSYT